MLSPHTHGIIDWGYAVNWSNPLSRGMSGFWLAGFNQTGFGSVRLRDIAKRNHGTLTNMNPASDWVFDNQLGALDFNADDVNDYVTFGQPLSSFITASAGTIVARVKYHAWGVEQDPASSWQRPTVFGETGGFMNGAYTETAGGQGRVANFNWDGNEDDTSTDAWFNVANNIWYSHGWRHGGGNLDLFMDGIQRACVLSGDTQTMSNNFRLGAVYTGSGPNPHFGRIACVAAWKRALSDAEMLVFHRETLLMFPNLLKRVSRRVNPVAEVAVGGSEGAALYHHLRNLGVYA